MDTPPSAKSNSCLDPSSLPSQALLQPWFAVLATLALLACGRALLLPPWPRAQPLDLARIEPVLSRVGLDPQSLPGQPPLRTERFALSPRLVWRLADGAELSLASVNVRRPSDFQVALFTRDIPQLALQQRRVDGPRSDLALGRIQGRQAWQTCLVPQGAQPATPAVTGHFLNLAVNGQVSSLGDRLLSLLGFGKPRPRHCLLVTLRTTTEAPPTQRLWQQVITSLQELERRPD